jgi:hypothetical protein
MSSIEEEYEGHEGAIATKKFLCDARSFSIFWFVCAPRMPSVVERFQNLTIDDTLDLAQGGPSITEVNRDAEALSSNIQRI